MRLRPVALLLCSSALAMHAQSDLYPGKKKLLAVADVRNGYQHDSISHALATIEHLGYESARSSRLFAPIRN